MALATLSIDLEARLAGLQTSLDRAARIADKNADQIRASYARLGSVITGLGSALAGALSAGTLAAFVRHTADALDALNDFADAVGTTVEKASALEDIAARTGTQFDVVTTAAVKLNQALNAAQPDSIQAKVLQAIGLAVKDLRAEDPADALLTVARALARFGDDGDKARIILELFGKQAREVAPFLKDLAERNELVGTVTADAAHEAERFNQSLARMHKDAVDAGRAIVGDLLPGITRVLAELQIGRKVFGGWADAILGIGLSKPFDDAGQAVAHYTAELQRLTRARRDAETGFSLFGTGALDADIAKAGKLLSYYRQLYQATAPDLGQSDPRELARRGRGGLLPTPDIGALLEKAPKAPRPAKEGFVGPELPESLKEALQFIQGTDEAKLARLRDLLAELTRIVAGGGSVPDSAFAKIAEDIARLDPSAQAAAKALDDMAQAQREAQRIFDETRTPAEVLANEIARLNDLLQKGVLDWDTYGRAQFAAQDRYDKAVGQTKDQGKDLADLAKQLGLSFSSAFEDAAIGGGKLRDVLRGLEQDIVRIILRQTVTQPLAGAVSSWVQGSGGIGGLLGGIGNWFGGLLGSARGNAFGPDGVQTFAAGGIVGAPTLFGFGGGRVGLMGEAGPEGVLPLRRSRDGRLGVIASGAARPITVNVTLPAGGDRRTALQQAEAIGRQVRIALSRNG